MKDLLKITIYLSLFALIGCKDNNNIADDPRIDFEGTYEIEEFQFRFIQTRSEEVTIDTMLTVTRHPVISFEIMEESLNSMRIEPAELTDDIQLEMFRSFGGSPGLIVKSIFPRQPRIVVTGGEFEFVNTRFEAEVSAGDQTATLLWDRFSGNGHFNGDILVFDFRVYTEIGEESLELKGTTTGLRQPF